MQISEISPKVDPANKTTPSDLSSVLWIMAFTAGAGISNVFYVQSMVDVIGKSLAMSPADLGLVPASTVGGYSLGLFFLVPLGDRFDRKRLILLQLVAVVASLLVMATTSSATMLLLGGLAVGISASFTQQIPPFASSLAPPDAAGALSVQWSVRSWWASCWRGRCRALPRSFSAGDRCFSALRR